ncbi:PadR family transcriptional regulator [Mageeibacillus indolicus]|uniref:Transcriptional regulator, PadR family n=2 Tax=Mageeibacillus indolicus TaxID=884684 RepID=D3R283_MAGIU|nr:PadR family transcriptional regulator [Mageeibacillus indolicus]ADC91101.1 transcriptional regulator, PadR family [Mageeibacillus indolicus UPII9-5]KFA57859.1 PadR family transcriptional regulator [Mageeibacillus indolicus 0009-5]PNH19778.1 PadR family transcriptional regulator [Mageeibacillus indolicus]
MYYSVSAQLIECMILAVLQKEDSYGYDISRPVKRVANINESTLYPILKRLEGGGFLSTYEKEIQGRRRKYYHLTTSGEARLKFLRDEWINYRDLLNIVIMEGKKDE